MKQYDARGWYLEHRDAGHFKFYTVILVGDVVVLNWGRIGTNGQIDLQTPARPELTALKKVADKTGKGYEARHDDVLFKVDERDLDGIRGLGRERPDPRRLTMLFDQALRDPKFTGDRDSVLVAYDALLNKAQLLMDGAAGKSFESVINDFEELKLAWAEIDDRHATAKITMDMTQKMLAQALMSGQLT